MHLCHTDGPNYQLDTTGREGPAPLPAAGRVPLTGSVACRPLCECWFYTAEHTRGRWKNKKPQRENQTMNILCQASKMKWLGAGKPDKHRSHQKAGRRRNKEEGAASFQLPVEMQLWLVLTPDVILCELKPSC